LLAFIFFTTTAIPTQIFANQPHEKLERAADSVYENAGGWGLKSALIYSASSAVKEYCNSQAEGTEFDSSNVIAFAKHSKFWGGLAGDLSFTMLISSIAPAIPGGIFVQTLAKVGAGFVGFEAGSGNLANTDWFSIGMQTLTATVTHLAITSLFAGLPFVGLIAGVVSIGAALGVAYLIDKYKGKSYLSKSAARGEASKDNDTAFYDSWSFSLETDDNTTNPISNKAIRKTDAQTIQELKACRNKSYELYIEAVRKGKNDGQISHLLEQYRTADYDLRIFKKQALSANQ